MLVSLHFTLHICHSFKATVILEDSHIIVTGAKLFCDVFVVSFQKYSKSVYLMMAMLPKACILI